MDGSLVGVLHEVTWRSVTCRNCTLSFGQGVLQLFLYSFFQICYVSVKLIRH